MASRQGLGAFTRTLCEILNDDFPKLSSGAVHAAFADVVKDAYASRGDAARLAGAVRDLHAERFPDVDAMTLTTALGLVAEEMARLEAAGERSPIADIARGRAAEDARDDRWTYEQFWNPAQRLLRLRFPDEEQLGRFCEKLVREQKFECRLDAPPKEFAALSLRVGVAGADAVQLAAGVVRVEPDGTVLCTVQHVPAPVRRTAARRRARLSSGNNPSVTQTGQVEVIRSAFSNDRDTLTPIGDFSRSTTDALPPTILRTDEVPVVSVRPTRTASLADTQITGASTTVSTALEDKRALGSIVARTCGRRVLGGPGELILRAACGAPGAVVDAATATGRWHIVVANGSIISARNIRAPNQRPIDNPAIGGLRAVMGDDVIAHQTGLYLNAPAIADRQALTPAWGWMTEVLAHRHLAEELARTRALFMHSTGRVARYAEGLLSLLPAAERHLVARIESGRTASQATEDTPTAWMELLRLVRAGVIDWNGQTDRAKRLDQAWQQIVSKTGADECLFDTVEAHWSDDSEGVRVAASATLNALDVEFIRREGSRMQYDLATRIEAKIRAAAEALQRPETREEERRLIVSGADRAIALRCFRAQVDLALRNANHARAVDGLRRIVELAPGDAMATEQLGALKVPKAATTVAE